MTTNYSKEFLLPPELPTILKDLTREILRNQPSDINKFALQYFESKISKKNAEASRNVALSTENSNEIQEHAHKFVNVTSSIETIPSTEPVDFADEVTITEPAASEYIESHIGEGKDVTDITTSEVQLNEALGEIAKDVSTDTYRENSSVDPNIETDSPKTEINISDQRNRENTIEAGEDFEPILSAVHPPIKESTDFAADSKTQQIDTAEEVGTEIEVSNFQPTTELTEFEFLDAKTKSSTNNINAKIASSVDLTDAVELHREAVIEAFAHVQSNAETPSVSIPTTSDVAFTEDNDSNIATVTSKGVDAYVDVAATSEMPESFYPDKSTEAAEYDVTTTETIEHYAAARSYGTEPVERDITTTEASEHDFGAQIYATEALEHVTTSEAAEHDVATSETIQHHVPASTYATEALVQATTSNTSEAVEHVVTTSEVVDHHTSAHTYATDALEHVTTTTTSEAVEHVVTTADAVEHHVAAHTYSTEALEHVTTSETAENAATALQASEHDVIPHTYATEALEHVPAPVAADHAVRTSEAIQHHISDHTYATEALEHVAKSEAAENVAATPETSEHDAIPHTYTPEHATKTAAVEHDVTTRSYATEAVERYVTTADATAHHVTDHTYTTEAYEHVTTLEAVENDAAAHTYPTEVLEHVTTSNAAEHYATTLEVFEHDVATSEAVEHDVTAHTYATEALQHVTTSEASEHATTVSEVVGHGVAVHSHVIEPLDHVPTSLGAEHDVISTIQNNVDLIKADEKDPKV